ncbi:MAG: hypothetical protein IIZ35_00265 [Clostridia bacterium]|nr:hypothetical protein [Clostridia bacterium]
MKRKALTALALAIALAAAALVFAGCSESGTDPKSTGEPATEETSTEAGEKTSAPEIDEDAAAVISDLYAIRGGDFSKLEKYWYGRFAHGILGDGRRMELVSTGYKTYDRLAVPIVMTDDRWDEMWAKAEEEYKDDPGFEFVRTKIGGFYALKDPSATPIEEERDDMGRWVRGWYSVDLNVSGSVYVCDPTAPYSRLEELEGYFNKYFGYTFDDVKEAAREAGMPEADLIGTEEPYFKVEYFGDDMTSTPRPYSEETVEKLESLCKVAPDMLGAPIRYYKFEYEVAEAKYESEGEEFESYRDRYLAETGEDLLGICKLVLNEKAVGETLASTGEYREYGPDEQEETTTYVVLLKTKNGWVPYQIDLPWRCSEREYSELFRESIF